MEVKVYQFSDAWFLTTLLLLKEWSSLKNVIAGGDVINHAIFLSDEINTALNAFTFLGFVEIDDQKQMRVTEKATALCDKAFEKAGLFRKVEYILYKLNELPYCLSDEGKQYFTESDIEEAYHQYTKKLRKK